MYSGFQITEFGCTLSAADYAAGIHVVTVNCMELSRILTVQAICVPSYVQRFPGEVGSFTW